MSGLMTILRDVPSSLTVTRPSAADISKISAKVPFTDPLRSLTLFPIRGFLPDPNLIFSRESGLIYIYHAVSYEDQRKPNVLTGSELMMRTETFPSASNFSTVPILPK